MTIDRLPSLVPGDTYPLRFTFSEGGVAVDVTDWQVQVMLKTDPTSPDADAVYDETTTGAGEDAEAGIIDAPIPHTATEGIAAGYIWVQARRIITGTPNDVRTIKLQKIIVEEAVIDDA